MIIQGTFNDIINENTYYVKIGNTGTINTIKSYDDYDPEDTESVFFSVSPVTISSDMSDTFDYVYIRSASINLITNFDARQYVIAKNYTDIPVEIRYDDENGEVIFSGFVVPLQYEQPYAHNFNEITIECVDKLGILEYIKFPTLLNNYDYNTPRYFMNLVLNECSFISINYNIIYDHTSDTKINPSLFIGASQDDWYTCKDVLNEIGKVYGCYFYQNGNSCFVENVLLYNLSNPQRITKDDYRGADTNISVQEAYNRIKYAVDLSTIDESFIDPFNEETLTTTTDVAERFLTEIVYNTTGFVTPFKGWCEVAYRHTPMIINWSDYFITQPRGTDDKISIFDNYCQIMKNTMFDFGQNSYLTNGYGENTTDAWRTLHWLWQNPGKGAFVSFGKTNNLSETINAEMIKIEDMKQYLLIQVNGTRTYVDGDTYNSNIANMLTNQFDSNNPICTLRLNQANNLIPSDKGAKNYLVIKGKIMLNPIVPRTGHNSFGRIYTGSGQNTQRRDPWFDTSPANAYVRCNLNTLDDTMTWWDEHWTQQTVTNNYALNSHYVIDYEQMKEYPAGTPLDEMKQDDANYYQYYSWINTQDYSSWPYNQTPVFTGPELALPYLSTEYKRFKYSTSTYDKSGESAAADTVSQVSVLACELKIGDKYLIENLDLLEQTNWTVPDNLLDQLFSWKTYDQCPVKNGVKQTWFTLSIHINPGDGIIGKEYDIRNTVTISTGIEDSGLCIPISYDDGLLGEFSFKILGPYNMAVNNISERDLYTTEMRNEHKAIFDWSPFVYKTGTDYNPLMAHVENILINDLEFKLHKGGSAYAKNNDNDLVYYSYTNDDYIEEQETDCILCTSLHDSEVPEGVDYSPNNSAIMALNNQPWYGMTYNNVSGVKLEEARVTEQYNIWKRPRNIIETTIKLSHPEESYHKTNYTFDYLKYDNNNYQIYKTISREIDLKLNKMQCTMKELSEIPT